MHDRFTENDGALSICLERRTFKYCRQCGLKLRGDKNIYRTTTRAFIEEWKPPGLSLVTYLFKAVI